MCGDMEREAEYVVAVAAVVAVLANPPKGWYHDSNEPVARTAHTTDIPCLDTDVDTALVGTLAIHPQKETGEWPP